MAIAPPCHFDGTSVYLPPPFSEPRSSPVPLQSIASSALPDKTVAPDLRPDTIHRQNPRLSTKNAIPCPQVFHAQRTEERTMETGSKRGARHARNVQNHRTRGHLTYQLRRGRQSRDIGAVLHGRSRSCARSQCRATDRKSTRLNS